MKLIFKGIHMRKNLIITGPSSWLGLRSCKVTETKNGVLKIEVSTLFVKDTLYRNLRNDARRVKITISWKGRIDIHVYSEEDVLGVYTVLPNLKLQYLKLF